MSHRFDVSMEFLFNLYDLIIKKNEYAIYTNKENDIEICSQKIIGENWDDQVDYRSAQYINALHEAIGDLYLSLTPNNIHYDISYLLKARFKKGSCEIAIDIAKVIHEIIYAIPEKYRYDFIIYLMMMGSGLYLTKNIFKTINIYIKSRYKYNYEMHNELREEINTEIEMIHKNKKILNIITYPYRVLARNISEDDILVLPACATDKENINNIILRDLSGIKTVYCDGDFYFHWLDVGGRRIATISNDNTTLYTKVRVDYNDYNDLLKMHEKNIKSALNINLRHIDNMYIDSLVVGVDKPRKHKNLFCISNFINPIG